MKRIKTAVLASSKSIGLFTAMGRSRWRTDRLLILGYHGISIDDEHVWNPALYMSQEALARRLELIVRNKCAVLPLREAVERLDRNDLPPRSVAITFDDGFYDFAARAHPVIQEFGVPVTVYQTSYYSEFNRPIFDVACSYILWKGAARQLDGRAFIGAPGMLDLSTVEGRTAVWIKIRHAAQRDGLSGQEKDVLLDRLAEALQVNGGRLRRNRVLHLMTPAELRQVASSGVDLQLHTHRHRVPMDRDLFLAEIADNRRFLAAVGQPSTDHFCYPSGAYHAAFLPWLGEAGVRAATTCDPGLATQRTPRLLLPRIIDSSALSDVEFEGWLYGVSDVLPRRPVQRSVALTAEVTR
jgi:peptidoglycan/xylan/chitin deacetylase (PgdA/CDA1 family)